MSNCSTVRKPRRSLLTSRRHASPIRKARPGLAFLCLIERRVRPCRPRKPAVFLARISTQAQCSSSASRPPLASTERAGRSSATGRPTFPRCVRGCSPLRGDRHLAAVAEGATAQTNDRRCLTALELAPGHHAGDPAQQFLLAGGFEPGDEGLCAAEFFRTQAASLDVQLEDLVEHRDRAAGCRRRVAPGASSAEGSLSRIARGMRSAACRWL
jgi:hypothetical protein